MADSSERPGFVPFNWYGEGNFYCRNLPHFRQPGRTYFVTFGQADAIPARVVSEWREDYQRWHEAHGIDLAWRKANPKLYDELYNQIPIEIRQAFERQQARRVHMEFDRCQGTCVLRDRNAREIIAESLHFLDDRRLRLGDYVIMPNHVHAVITPFTGRPLESLLASIKKWTSRRISQLSTVRGVLPERDDATRKRMWRSECYDRIIRDVDELRRIRHYIAENPAHLPAGTFTYHRADWLDAYADILS